jgi:predicted acetyltransferase
MALHDGSVSLRYTRKVYPRKRGLSPYYHFRIYFGPQDVGHLNLRVGENEHLQRVVGHIGFGIRKRFRGNRFAYSACLALAPFARTMMREVILTCDPANHASRRILERLVGGERGEAVRVPRDDPHYRRGARTKLRFRWVP